MNLIKIIYGNKPALINGDHVISVNYEEEALRLEIKLVNGEALKLDGDEAADAWISFIGEIVNDGRGGLDDDLDEDEPASDFEGFNREIADLENQVRHQSVTRAYEARSLRARAEMLGSYWDPKKRKLLAEEIKKVQERAYAVADEAETQAHTNAIDKCLRDQIINTSSTKAILKRLNEAAAALENSSKLTDELKGKVRSAKERIAWFRAKKKLDEAHVAAAGGSHIKHEKYRNEAAALLKQDWATMFPDEGAPEIDSQVNAEHLQPKLVS